MTILNQTIFNNPLHDYLYSLLIFLLACLVLRLLKRFGIRRLKKMAALTQSNLDDFIIIQLEKTLWPILYVLVFNLSQRYLTFSDKVNWVISTLTLILITFFIIRFLAALVNYLIHSLVFRGSSDYNEIKTTGMSTLVNVLIGSLGLIFLLDNLGVEISTVITGFGIGGIAIALAAQTVLGDLFSYFAIFLDHPFKVGDFITIEDKSGTIERIGIKTTRIKSINGEELVFSNHDLTNSRIHNYNLMEKRRVILKLGVCYQTSTEKLRQIPAIIQRIVESTDGTEFDRSHFKEYGDSALIFETAYYAVGSDYKVFMDIQQAINLRIFEIFSQQGIEFAYPTRSVFLKKAD